MYAVTALAAIAAPVVASVRSTGLYRHIGVCAFTAAWVAKPTSTPIYLGACTGIDCMVLPFVFAGLLPTMPALGIVGSNLLLALFGTLGYRDPGILYRSRYARYGLIRAMQTQGSKADKQNHTQSMHNTTFSS